MDEILVSIICAAYNHEKYIADALDGFLMQKANFKYEILVHDDASTDNTQNIIRAYVNKYPDIIKPIYQTENQFSKGRKILTIITARAMGKYIALCEGDDYWTDPLKLQKQVDYMEQHSDCSLCVHATYRVNVSRKMLKNHIRPSIGNKIIPVEDVIGEDKGGYFHTTSFLFPSSLINELPQFYYEAPVGDYPISIFLALKGKVYYIDQFMSAYRNNTIGSWTSRVLNNNKKFVEFVEKINLMLDEINLYTGLKYSDAVAEAKRMYKFRKLLAIGMYTEAKQEEYSKFYMQLGIIERSKITFKEHFPQMTKLVIDIKNKL